jgi:hypothetical protein
MTKKTIIKRIIGWLLVIHIAPALMFLIEPNIVKPFINPYVDGLIIFITGIIGGFLILVFKILFNWLFEEEL